MKLQRRLRPPKRFLSKVFAAAAQRVTALELLSLSALFEVAAIVSAMCEPLAIGQIVPISLQHSAIFTAFR